MPGLTSNFGPAYRPFSSPGTRKGTARCACTNSALLVPPQPEEKVAHLPALQAPSTLSAGSALASAACLGQRPEANNIVPHSGLGQNQTPSHAQAQGPGQSGPGRPKGKPAWNKGKSMSASTKQHLSQSQKDRWQENPGLRAVVSSRLKGKEPWNKGQNLNSDTCQRMSAAHQGRAVPRHVCAKMSKAHMGLRPSEATRGAMSQALTGVPKAAEHKAKIAAAQRRRHAAARVLTAVEAFHREAELSQSEPSKSPLGSPIKPGQGRKKKSPVRCLSSRNSQPKASTKTQIMTAYKAELREYRLLQEELGPWTQAFKAQHGRKPNLADVERTGIDWLLDKFKSYVILRDRLLSDTSILRDKLHVAAPEVSNGQSSSNGSSGRSAGLKAASYATKLNANAASAKRSQAQSAATFQAALEYRRQQQALADTAAISAAAAEAATTAAALEAAAEVALAKAAAVSAVAKSAATAVEAASAGGLAAADGEVVHALHAEPGLDGSNQAGHSSKLNGVMTQHAQQALTVENDSLHRRGHADAVQHAPFAQNGSQHASTGQNEAHQNDSARSSDAQHAEKAASNGASSTSGASHRSPDPFQNNGSSASAPATTISNGSTSRASNGSVMNNASPAAQTASAPPSTSSSATVTEDAMAAAVASIRLQQNDAKSTVPVGAKAIPTAAPGASPRMKSALLAAQEYRKVKAAKTAALAVAAAAAAAAKSRKA